jgi:hypothetical protein
METSMKQIAILVDVLTIAGIAFVVWPKTDQNRLKKSGGGVGNTTLAEVQLPSTLSQSAQIGKRTFAFGVFQYL